MATEASNGSYRANVRTANTPVVTDAAMLNSTEATLRISAYGHYYQRNNKTGLLITAARVAYNLTQ